MSSVCAEHLLIAKVTVNINKDGLNSINFLTLKDDVCINLILKFLKSLVLRFLLSCQSSFFFTDDFLFFCFNFVLFSFLYSVIPLFQGTLMLVLCLKNSLINDGLRSFRNRGVLVDESHYLTHEPWYHLFLHSSFSRFDQHSLGSQLLHSILSYTSHPWFSNHTSIYLLMGRFLLFFSCLILELSTLTFFLASELGCLVPLSND